jgi:hypothetical protein
LTLLTPSSGVTASTVGVEVIRQRAVLVEIEIEVRCHRRVDDVGAEADEQSVAIRERARPGRRCSIRRRGYSRSHLLAGIWPILARNARGNIGGAAGGSPLMKWIGALGSLARVVGDGERYNGRDDRYLSCFSP